jgi:asparagine synthase (glutamine-hydrolysing)
VGETAALTQNPHDLHRVRLDPADLRKRLTTGEGLADISAPFAAVTGDDTGGLAVATDQLGLCQVYGVQGDGWGAVSTSARQLGLLAGAALDRTALGVYRLVGYHLGEATAFSGVGTLPAGHRWHLANGALTELAYPTENVAPDHLSVDEAVRWCADLLRENLEQCLDEFPDAVFQLSGGLDTRVLLAAIPPARRRGLRALTLRSAGNADDTVAALLAERYGMTHELIDLGGLDLLGPAEIHELVHSAALGNEQIFSPLQLGMIEWAETEAAKRYEGAARIDGIGGEITRGMYHSLQRQHPTVTPQLVERLARWRIFSRDAVDSTCLEPGFAAESQVAALDRLQATFAEYDMDWLSATDAYWYTIRSHRAVGAVQTQAGRRRTVLSPFTHPQFVAIAAALPATAKRGSRFNSQVVAALDPELAAIPMDTGVRPSALTAPRPIALLRTGRDYAHRVSGKVKQRISRDGVSSTVPLTLTRGLVAHWRANPELLEPVAATNLFRRQWLEALLAGEQSPAPATAAFIALLEAATSSQSTSSQS